MWGEYLTIPDQKNIGAIEFGHESLRVQHQTGIGAGHVGLNFGEDIVEQIAVVDLGIQVKGRISHYRGADDTDTRLVVVYRWFPLSQHDETGARLVEPGIHSAGYFFTPGQGQS